VFAENRIGADGIIGTLACAKSPPDGQTLCSTGNTVISMNPVLHAKLPYDPLRDLAGVVNTGFMDSCLTVNAAVSANSVKELLALAKAKPDGINWGHFGVSSTGYLYEEYLKKTRGAPFYPVPYKATPQVLQALASGEVHAAVYSWSQILPFVKSGKMKCIAITSAQRHPVFPNVPTFDEEGIRLPLRGWFGWHYQAATPRPIVQRMSAEIHKATSTPAYRELMASLGIQPNEGTPEEFDAFVRDQIRQTIDLVKLLGVKPLED
jgi:tripartite-type tricarboxylate transporter receptor subunit TctC